MPIKTDFDCNKNLVTHKVTDGIDFDDLIDAFEKVFFELNIRQDSNILVDMRDGYLHQLTVEDMSRFASLTKNLGKARGHGRSAIVTAKGSDMALSQILSMEIGTAERKLALFKTIEEAMQWLEAATVQD